MSKTRKSPTWRVFYCRSTYKWIEATLNGWRFKNLIASSLLKDLAMLRNLSIFMFGMLLALPVWSTPNIVEMQTNLGTITIRLDPVKAPITVNNFLAYINDGFYNQTLFHRVSKGFVIQGGGADLVTGTFKATKSPIENEANNGLSNLKGAISMARLDTKNSATSQFFINLADNIALDYSAEVAGPPKVAEKPGYAVFGEVIDGMDVVNAIGNSVNYREFPYTADNQLVYIEKVYLSDDVDLVNAHTRVTVSSGGKVTSLPGGINCNAKGGACESSKAKGESKTQILIAKPDSKYLFSGWSGDCVGNKAAIRLPLTRNHNCKANFTAAAVQK